MKNDCVILKKKEYEDLVAKANGNKPDYIKVIINVKTMGSMPKNIDLLLLDTSLNFSEGIQNQILTIKRNLEYKFDNLLETWEERQNKRISWDTISKVSETEKRIKHKIVNDLEDLLITPFWAVKSMLRRKWQEIVQNDKSFEL